MEQELEGNEWLQDIRCQVRRLTGLTQDLIFLSRMEEETPPIQPIEFPLSDLTEEMAQSFQGLAKAQEKGSRCPSHPYSPIPEMKKLSGSCCPFCWTMP